MARVHAAGRQKVKQGPNLMVWILTTCESNKSALYFKLEATTTNAFH